MQPTQLAERFFVAGQITTGDVDALSAQGFKMIICNRPDGEEPDQPTEAEIRQAVENAGMTFVFVPFNPAMPDPNMVPDFAAAWEQSEGKVLAYCRTGNRSSRLWAAIS